jgi:hypothetical protein
MGLPGVKGDTGSSGSSGTGSPGTSGSSGQTGSPGTSGSSGQTGSPGTSGSSGQTGGSGTSGSSGTGFSTISGATDNRVLTSDGSANAAVAEPNLTFDGTTLSSTRLTLTETTAAPMTVASSTRVINLNADLLDGQEGSYYLAYGNFTGTPTIPTVNNNIITLTAGTGMTGNSSFSLNQGTDQTITFNVVAGTGLITSANDISHADTSTLTGIQGSNGISSITVDDLGHVTAVTTATYTGNTGTVTSVSGTGTASGLSLSGTVTTSGDITLSGTVNSLAAGTYAINISGNAATITSQANSATITATTAATADRIVLRDSNGDDFRRYGFASYFNSSDDVSASNITYIMAKFGDNYFRSATAAKVASFISGQTMNINGSATGVTGIVPITNGGTGATTAADARGNLLAAATNQTMHIGTTAVAINRASAALSLTGVNIDGTAGSITNQANSATITATSANTANQIVLRDGSGGFNAATINASGYVNANGESLSTSLRVGGIYGDLGLYVSDTYNMQFDLGWDGNFQWSRGNAVKMELTYDGNLTTKLNITGYGTPSDERYKYNIQPIGNALNTILQLNGVTFNWKQNTPSYKITKLDNDIGFIAQQVQETLPELVREGEDGYLSIRERAIVPLLVEAIKEQQKQIDELKKKLGTE